MEFFWKVNELKGDKISIEIDFVHKDELSQTVFGREELIFNIKENELIRSASSFNKPYKFQDQTFELLAINTDLLM